jgi:lysozyme
VLLRVPVPPRRGPRGPAGPTIGYGRNLEAVGLSLPEAAGLLQNDLDRAIAALARRWPWTGMLAEARLGALIAMCFNLGAAKLAEFTKMWAALKEGDFDRAAAEMLDSRWARQVGARARRLAQQMRSGAWPETS